MFYLKCIYIITIYVQYLIKCSTVTNAFFIESLLLITIITSFQVDPAVLKRKPVKVFDIQHQTQSSSLSGGSLVSEMATSADGGSSSSSESNKQQQPNFNLVKLFMKQKSMSAEGMSASIKFYYR